MIRAKYIYSIIVFLITIDLHSQSKEITFAAIEGSSYTNYAVTILSEAYDRLGLKLKVVSLPPKRSLSTSNAGGEFSGELFRISGVEKTYENLIPIEVPLSYSEWIVYTIDHDFAVNGWESLRPYTIGVRNGIATTDYGTLGMNTEKVHTNEQLFNLLKIGRVDIVVMSKTNAARIQRRNPTPGLKALTPPVQEIPVYHFIHKDRNYLIPQITEVLQQMKEEGFIDNAFNDYWEFLLSQD